MNQTHASKIEAANTALIVHGNVDAIADCFTNDYIAHVTGRDIASGHDTIRTIINTHHRAFTDLRVDVDILIDADDRIAEEWVSTDLAEQLLLARKK